MFPPGVHLILLSASWPQACSGRRLPCTHLCSAPRACPGFSFSLHVTADLSLFIDACRPLHMALFCSAWHWGKSCWMIFEGTREDKKWENGRLDLRWQRWEIKAIRAHLQCALIESSFKVFFQIINSLTAVFVQESDRGNNTHVYTLQCRGEGRVPSFIYLKRFEIQQTSRPASRQNRHSPVELWHPQTRLYNNGVVWEVLLWASATSLCSPYRLGCVQRGSAEARAFFALECVAVSHFSPCFTKWSCGPAWTRKVPQGSNLCCVSGSSLNSVKHPY